MLVKPDGADQREEVRCGAVRCGAVLFDEVASAANSGLSCFVRYAVLR